MCMFKSGIILKDRVFVPDYDSHTEMLEALKIADTRQNAERLFVRAELIPKNNDVFSPIDEWEYNVDQDILPDWYVGEYEEKRMREAVKEWAKSHIHIGIDNLVIEEGKSHYIKDCKNVVVKGSATVKEVCGSATVNYVCDSATVNYVCGSATVKEVCDSATVNYVFGSATVKEVCDSATVNYVFGSATVNYVCGSATVNKVFGSATVKEVCGSATVNKVFGSATVNKVFGSATVKEVCGSATVNYVCDSATVNKVCGSATVISSPYTDWNKKGTLIISENATFKDNYTKTIWQSGDFEIRVVGEENND